MPFKDKDKARESSRKASRQYYALHPDRVKESQKRHRAKNPEWFQKFKSEYAETQISNSRRSALKRYGLTLEQFDQMLRYQGFACAICGNGDPGATNKHRARQWHVDHCHATGRVRGLLCGKCNMALGLLKDNIVILKSAIRYLTRREK